MALMELNLSFTGRILNNNVTSISSIVFCFAFVVVSIISLTNEK